MNGLFRMLSNLSRLGLAVIACLVMPVAARSATPASPAVAGTDDSAMRFFESHVRPLLVEHCLECHGPEEASGSLRLDSLAGVLTGGDSGPAVVAGDSEASLLLAAVRYDGYEMPPSGPLPAEHVEVLRQWIDAGAPWPGASPGEVVDRPAAGPKFTDEDRRWWAIQPLADPAPPPVPASLSGWPAGDLDRFVAQKLDDAGLSPAPPADQITLLRRTFSTCSGFPHHPTKSQRF